MCRPNIDWNALWRKAHLERHSTLRDSAFWDKRAPEFARHAKASGYVDQFTAIMKPQPSWSVLDIGCAAGTLAVPLASSVRCITAMDPSVRMRELLEDRCHRQGIKNITIVDGRWEDDWDELGIGVHDVIIASRSLIVEDLRGAIMKLQRNASRRVYISTLVGDGPHNREIIEAVGRDFCPGADYIVLMNLLREMQIFANLAFTCNSDEKTYGDVDEAVASLHWMIHEMNRKEEEKLRNYLYQNLVRENGRWKLPYRRTVRWAVIWWDMDCVKNA